MRRILIFILCLIGGTAGGLAFKKNYLAEDLPLTYQKLSIISQKEKEVGLPKKIIIEDIGVNTNIETVGIDDKGRMDVPKDVFNVSWYKNGVKPGEIGNATIAGHLDSKDGPAIFYNLSELELGDSIKIEDENGSNYEFEVKEIKTYELSQFPSDLIFGKSDKVKLNLITCEGTYSGKIGTYSHRLVAFAELKQN